MSRVMMAVSAIFCSAIIYFLRDDLFNGVRIISCYLGTLAIDLYLSRGRSKS